MKKIILLISIMLTGCSDGPKTPEIKDINNITINGKAYKAFEYVKEFCQFPEAEKDINCFKAAKQRSKDSSRMVKVTPVH
jgi:hypothetical protein